MDPDHHQTHLMTSSVVVNQALTGTTYRQYLESSLPGASSVRAVCKQSILRTFLL
jgi:hypothetical protein